MSEINISITPQEANFILQAIDHMSRLGIVNEITQNIAQKIINAKDN